MREITSRLTRGRQARPLLFAVNLACRPRVKRFKILNGMARNFFQNLIAIGSPCCFAC